MNKDVIRVQQELNNISPSFCVAKWKQVTMHLQNGHTHSCHHPSTHFIPLEEIKLNSSALHNTEFKKQQRKLMLEGIRPSECDYCWRVEDAGEISDRVFKSADRNWAYEYMNEVASMPWDTNVDPSYVEVSFGNVCNFKCSYCSPHISSQWMEEIERFGPYPTTHEFNNLVWLKQNNQIPIPNNQENPYVEAFWNWFPDMYRNLKHFRITGGEPLLNKNTFKVLDYIIENPNPNLHVSINTNMNPPVEIFNKFIEKIKIIIDEGKVKNFTLFTSAESHGKQSEYIRYGMNYNEWIENMHKMYEVVPNIQFTIMSTYNFLSIPKYVDFLRDILAFKRLYGTKDYNPILLDIPYLRHPPHQSIFMIENEHLSLIEDQVTFMSLNVEYTGWEKSINRGFSTWEMNQIKRIFEMAQHSLSETNEFTNTNRKDFIIFVDEHDRRRGTNFNEVFPELTDTYNKWKTLC